MSKMALQFAIGILLVLGLSWLSSRLWGGKPEAPPEDKTWVYRPEMTVEQFGSQNGLSLQALKAVFGLKSPQDAGQTVSSFALSKEQVFDQAAKAQAIQAEHGSKNWFKIRLKFALWLAFLGTVFVLMRRGRVTAGSRKWLYVGSLATFGVALGSDPSPMGTVKDAIVLLGAKGVVFPPRLIAFGVFMLLVILANKFICGWGCQVGTLQDAIFRLNRDRRDRAGRFGQFKIPFAVTNTVRIVFFAGLTAAAFLWATDIVEPVDPFKAFKPQMLGIVGGVFLGGVLLLSLFVYRPWCHLFCPFGLVGWLAEKISLTKVRVDYDKCIGCEACSKACPSAVMDAILKQDRVAPDCFACGTCIETCPTRAISWSAGKRAAPPAGKFGGSPGTEAPTEPPPAPDQAAHQTRQDAAE